LTSLNSIRWYESCTVMKGTLLSIWVTEISYGC